MAYNTDEIFRQYKMVRLVNDHDHLVSTGADYDSRQYYLGTLKVGTVEKYLVAVAVVGEIGQRTTNIVYRDKEDGRLHVSTNARWTLSPDQLRTLLKDGFLMEEGSGMAPRVFRVLRNEDPLPV